MTARKREKIFICDRRDPVCAVLAVEFPKVHRVVHGARRIAEVAQTVSTPAARNLIEALASQFPPAERERFMPTIAEAMVYGALIQRGEDPKPTEKAKK
jgi:hypothetical protein